MSKQSFTIQVPQTVLDDLQKRLTNTRWPDEPEGAGWSYGTNLTYLRSLVDYWQHKYDWRKHEEELNKFAQFKSTIDGIDIHFIYEKGKGPNSRPLILTHGWPDSFYRYHMVIPMLTDPEKYGGKAEDSFDVVVPSLPGFGFSERKAMSSQKVADLLSKLMTEELGYDRFAAAGGDLGSNVCRALALQHPDQVAAIHMLEAPYPTGNEDRSTMTDAEREYADFIQKWWFSEGAYNLLQSTKPQSIAVGLNDSPVGWAAWVASFVDTGSDNHNIDAAFGSRDELLTNIMIYWVTQTAGSAARAYLEEAHAAYAPSGDSPVTSKSKAPAGLALFPRQAQFPQEWAERTLNVQSFTKMPKGGHFASIEEPELYTNDLRKFLVQHYR